MKIKLKGNIYVSGFETCEEADETWFNHMWLFNYRGLAGYVLIYKGYATEISEELAVECVEYSADTPFSRANGGLYRSYSSGDTPKYYICMNGRASILSACKSPYLLIYKDEMEDSCE